MVCKFRPGSKVYSSSRRLHSSSARAVIFGVQLNSLSPTTTVAEEEEVTQRERREEGGLEGGRQAGRAYMGLSGRNASLLLAALREIITPEGSNQRERGPALH